MTKMCASRKSNFGRCDLVKHEGTLHAVYIGDNGPWFVYETVKGKAKPIGYRG